jgi:hypothetical protein
METASCAKTRQQLIRMNLQRPPDNRRYHAANLDPADVLLRVVRWQVPYRETAV